MCSAGPRVRPLFDLVHSDGRQTFSRSSTMYSSLNTMYSSPNEMLVRERRAELSRASELRERPAARCGSSSTPGWRVGRIPRAEVGASEEPVDFGGGGCLGHRDLVILCSGRPSPLTPLRPEVRSFRGCGVGA